MSLSIITDEECKQRIRQLQSDWQITLPPPTQMSRSPSPPTHRTPDAELAADAVLRKRQLEATTGPKKDSTLKRAFTSRNKKNWQISELLDALDTLIRDDGDPGVAGVLLERLAVQGGSVNEVAMAKRGGLIGRRRSDGILFPTERMRIVQSAVERRNMEILKVLLPYADNESLDSSIAMAAMLQDQPMVNLLASYGADIFRNHIGESTFRQLCSFGGQHDILQPLISVPRTSSPIALSVGLVDAVKAGCLPSVLLMIQSTADADLNDAEALKIAVEMCRKDLALALIIARRPPKIPGLEAALDVLFSLPQVHPHEKLGITELLLCAGARGDAAARALLYASNAQFLEMVRLLVRYGASLHYENGAAVREAVSKGYDGLLDAQLSTGAPLSPVLASECVGLIPAHVEPECRVALLTMLLHKGASGGGLNEALLAAVRAGDERTVGLLVTPRFGEGDAQSSPGRKGLNSHATASVDYKDGEAIAIALAAGDLHILALLLQAGPKGETLSKTFGGARRLRKEERRTAVQAFLIAGVSQDAVTAEFQWEIEQPAGHRDDELITMMLSYSSNSPQSATLDGFSSGGFDGGAAVVAAISRQDRALLATVLQHASPTVAAEGIPMASGIEDREMRRELLGLLLEAGAEVGKEQIIGAVSKVLGEENVDVKLLRLLLTRGHADMNAKEGALVLTAVNHIDILILPLVLKNTTLTPETVTTAITHLLHQTNPPTKATTSHLLAFLRLPAHKPTLSNLLPLAVEIYLSTPISLRSTNILQALLAAGASVDAPGGLALARAVSSAHMPLTEMLLMQGAGAETLAVAFRQAINILDPMDRFTFAERLLKAPPILPTEVDLALVYSIQKYPDDLGLLRLLAEKADMTSGEALGTAIGSRKIEVVKLLLRYKNTTKALDEGFSKALGLLSREERLEMCEVLLAVGISKEIVSESLPIAAGQGDLDLVNILVRKGASLDDLGGQAIVQASRSGSVDMLGALLSDSDSDSDSDSCKNSQGVSKDPEILTAAFRAATEISDLDLRSDVVGLLLGQRVIPTDVLSAELLSATRYGDTGIKLLTVLVYHGADPNFNNGEAICAAIKSAHRRSLELLLGRSSIAGPDQIKPLSASLAPALKASWRLSRDTRLELAGWLFDAGLQPCHDLHVALQKTAVYNALEGEKPDFDMVDLLLSKGASPTYRNCAALIRAAGAPSAELLSRFIAGAEISSQEATMVFANVFTEAEVMIWFSEEGCECAELLLSKGASGDPLSAALAITIDAATVPESHALALLFCQTFVKHGASADFADSRALCTAVSRGNIPCVELLLLQATPSPNTLQLALGHVFTGDHDENMTTDLLRLIVGNNPSSGIDAHEPLALQGVRMPVLAHALQKYPRSVEIMAVLLGAGYYCDPFVSASVCGGPVENVTLLTWALAQPEKRVSSPVINFLVKSGADVNFRTPSLEVTPLMLAIRELRKDVVETLLLGGADVDAMDVDGTRPLFIATSLHGQTAVDIASLLLVMKPDQDDGSLHVAARQLNLEMMELLLENGHNPDYPSPAHDGRSALGELCLHGCTIDDRSITPAHQRLVEKSISLLLTHGSDFHLESFDPSLPPSSSSGKTLLHLSMDSTAPISTLKALLKAGLWKSINEPWTYYIHENVTYSLTMYVRHIRPWDCSSDALLALLRNNRALDVYFATFGPQPPGATGLPEDLAAAERARVARETQLRIAREDHLQRMAHQRELAALDTQLWQERAVLEKRHHERLHQDDLAALRERRAAEMAHMVAVSSEKDRTLRAEREQMMILDKVSAARALRELEAEERRQRKVVEFEGRVNAARLENQKAISAIQYDRQQSVGRFEKEASERDLARIKAQKTLIAEQSALAVQLGEARAMGGTGRPGRPPIGYVTDLH